MRTFSDKRNDCNWFFLIIPSIYFVSRLCMCPHTLSWNTFEYTSSHNISCHINTIPIYNPFLIFFSLSFSLSIFQLFITLNVILKKRFLYGVFESKNIQKSRLDRITSYIWLQIKFTTVFRNSVWHFVKYTLGTFSVEFPFRRFSKEKKCLIV